MSSDRGGADARPLHHEPDPPADPGISRWPAVGTGDRKARGANRGSGSLRAGSCRRCQDGGSGGCGEVCRPFRPRVARVARAGAECSGSKPIREPPRSGPCCGRCSSARSERCRHAGTPGAPLSRIVSKREQSIRSVKFGAIPAQYGVMEGCFSSERRKHREAKTRETGPTLLTEAFTLVEMPMSSSSLRECSCPPDCKYRRVKCTGNLEQVFPSL